MIYKRTSIFIVLCLCIHISSMSQNKQKSAVNERIMDASNCSVDFDRLNSLSNENLGMQAYMLFLNKDYKNAAKSYLEIIEHNIDDSHSLYMLACCYAMLEKPEYAVNFLIMAINAGFNDYTRIKNEKSFRVVANNAAFNNVLKEVMSFGKKYGETIYVESNVLIKCRLIVPANYNPEKRYSLLVGLHGFGGNAENFSSLSEKIESDDFIYVIPEAPYLVESSGDGNYRYSWDIRVNNRELWKKSDPEVIKYIMNVVSYMNENYRIDKNYILGFSQGAAYAYATGIINSDKIDGVIAFGGMLPETKEYPWFISEENLMNGKNLKVFIAHGRNDEAISYKRANEASKKLSKLNYDVELMIFDGGHVVKKEVVTDALNWIINR